MSVSRQSLDRMEQSLRIKQMEVDIMLKEQAFKFAPIRLFMVFAGAASALLAAIFAGLKLFLGP
jgi:hypothetical protein